MLLLFETIFAKEAKKRLQLLRKTPRPVAFIGYACTGLQCVLSGNQVAQIRRKVFCRIIGNDARQTLNGNIPFGDNREVCREIQPDL